MKWLSHSPEGFTGYYIFLLKPPQQQAVRRHIRYSGSQVRYSRIPGHSPQEPLDLPPSSELTVLGHLCCFVQDFGCSSPCQTQTRLQKPQETSKTQDLTKGDFRATGSWERKAGKHPPPPLIFRHGFLKRLSLSPSRPLAHPCSLQCLLPHAGRILRGLGTVGLFLALLGFTVGIYMASCGETCSQCHV